MPTTYCLKIKFSKNSNGFYTFIAIVQTYCPVPSRTDIVRVMRMQYTICLHHTCLRNIYHIILFREIIRYLFKKLFNQCWIYKYY